MQAIKYYTNVLSNGLIKIPEEVRKEYLLKKGKKLEVILSLITVKNRSDKIKSLQKEIQEEARRNIKNKLSIKEIDKIVHKIRKS